MRLFQLFFWGAAAALAAAGNVGDESEDEIEDEVKPTTFNGKTVPPLLELTPHNWETEKKVSAWLMVKHFSPTCPHCFRFAPTYQTLYEYYYTSKPAGSGNENQDFTKFYDFRFASMNCLAFSDLCHDLEIKTYPTTIIYKDGELYKKFSGTRDLQTLIESVEVVLEKIKPGTRPAKLNLPEAGDTRTPDGTKGFAEKSEHTSTAAAGTSSGEKVVASEDKPVVHSDEKSEKVLEGKKTEGPATLVKSEEIKLESKPYLPFRARPPKKMLKLSHDSNPKGMPEPLNAETFKSRVTMTMDPWFIKFFAPWCHHCQAMRPGWEQLAKKMQGQLNIGEVDCTTESRLCKDIGVRGYPTLHFFRGAERIEYEGLRGLGDFIQFAEKAVDVAGGIQDVDAASFKALEEKEEVIFVYFYDHATTTEDFMALERLPLSLIGHAKLVMTSDPEMYNRFKITTWPRLLCSREGRPTYYTALTPNEMRDVTGVLDWMRSVWLPIVPELTASNAREIMDGKIVVLGILNPADQEATAGAKREMKSAASEWMDKQIQLFQLERQELRDTKQLRIAEAEDRRDWRGVRAAKQIRITMDRAGRKEVAFAWVDGVFWQRWLRTTYGIDIQNGERVIINDEDKRRYWDETITGNPITPSRTSILETINKVTAQPPQIKPKLTISAFEKIFFDIRVTVTEHPWLSLGCLASVGVISSSWLRGRLRRSRGGHFRLDDKTPMLLGNSNGKVD